MALRYPAQHGGQRHKTLPSNLRLHLAPTYFLLYRGGGFWHNILHRAGLFWRILPTVKLILGTTGTFVSFD